MKRWALLGVALLAACGGPPPPEPVAPPLQDIVRRHWDQACRDSRADPGVFQVSELFDTVGLGGELEAKGLRPPTRVRQNPSLDFVTRYRADGSISAMGVFDFSLDTAQAIELEVVLRSRALRVPRLLKDTGFRSRLTLTPMPRLEVMPPIVCLPHMVHRDGEPPPGLPDSVRTWVGRTSVRPGNDSTTQVSIEIGMDGEVGAIEKRRGSDHAFAEARRIIRNLRFDPALMNGEAVADVLTQSFRFRRSTDLVAGVADSLFLAKRGFGARAGAFSALAREGPLDSTDTRLPSQILSTLESVRMVDSGVGKVLYLSSEAQDDACAASVYVNGALMGAGEPGGAGGLDAVASGAGLTGLELYEQASTPVPDSIGCGTLLLWSRGLSDVVDQPLLGQVEGFLKGLNDVLMRPGLSELMLEPGGLRTYVGRNGRFTLVALPGAYEVSLIQNGRRVWSDHIVIRAGRATLDLDIGRR